MRHAAGLGCLRHLFLAFVTTSDFACDWMYAKLDLFLTEVLWVLNWFPDCRIIIGFMIFHDV